MPAKQSHRIAVLMGGPSAEAAVSRSSAAGVAEALRETYADVVTLELDAACAVELARLQPAAVFPALHGPPGEDGTVQGMLEMLGLPYVGSGVRASACAMDKALAKQIFRAAGLPVASDVLVRRHEDIDEALARVIDTLGTSVVVKPTRQGSALGVGLCEDAQQVAAALEAALAFDDLVLVEERVMGREITVGVLDALAGDGRLERHAHPVIEILTPTGTWYDYEHRYTAGESRHQMPAEIPNDIAEALQAIAMTAHDWLGCRDLSRADFVLGHDGRIVLLEVNTLPGMTPTSLYPEGAAALGHDFPALTALLVHNALTRGPDRELAPAAG
ncbi:MAG TPA: D-alanine--D-alanine ligase [Pseudomonadales bacterium]|nr:D-alanine--D-alanine ligase [Pseudomonadales bacterium]